MTDPTVAFTGYGHYRPKRSVKTPLLTGGIKLTTSHPEDAVVGGIGVEARNLASNDETIVFMGAEAARMALEKARTTATEIDLLILGNWTQRQWIPELAPQIAQSIGANRAFSFDISTACFGFVHSVITARAFLLADPERYSKVLVVCSERFSDRVRPGSKGQLIVADGAGAIVLERDDSGHTGIINYVEESRGDLKDLVSVKRPEGWVRSQPNLPDEVSSSTTRHVQHLLTSAGLTTEDLTWFIPHPGTEPVHQELIRRLAIPWEKVLINFKTTGNLSAASVPLLLSEMRLEDKIKVGELIMIMAVGSGFYSGGLLVRL